MSFSKSWIIYRYNFFDFHWLLQTVKDPKIFWKVPRTWKPFKIQKNLILGIGEGGKEQPSVTSGCRLRILWVLRYIQWGADQTTHLLVYDQTRGTLEWHKRPQIPQNTIELLHDSQPPFLRQLTKERVVFHFWKLWLCDSKKVLKLEKSLSWKALNKFFTFLIGWAWQSP